jgi:glycosyltransferase involved in cell wall biosynthesis
MSQTKGKFHFGIRLIKLVFFLIFKSFRKNTVFVSWFADYHSALASFIGKLTNTKSIIFIGGQEAVSYHELQKGVYRKKIRSVCVKYALRNTDLIIANHKSLIYHENYYYNSENPHIDGIIHYVKNLNTATEILYNGIDSSRFIRDLNINKDDKLILTVGTMHHIGDFKNKGFDLFIETARLEPSLNFVLIGLNPNYIDWTEENYKVSELTNLRIIPSFCPQDLLLEMYNKAKVFVQASITEGMPNTLSEAMLLECIPVGSNVNGIPDAIGDTGIIIKERNARVLKTAITNAVKLNTAKLARQRVIDEFSIELRELELLKILEKHKITN